MTHPVPLLEDARARILGVALRGRSAVLIEQVVTSGTMFGTGVLLARWLPAEAFAGVALVLAISMLVAAALDALVIEPMLVLGTAKWRGARGAHAAVLARYLRIATACTAVVAALAVNVVDRRVVESVIGILLALVMTQAWSYRRLHQADGRPEAALAASATGSVVALGMLVTLHAISRLDVVTGLGALMAAYGLAAVVGARRVPVDIAPEALPDDATVIGEHLRYGCTSLPAAAFAWIVHQAAIPLAAFLLFADATAALRALITLIAPTHAVAVTLGAHALPAIAPRDGRRVPAPGPVRREAARTVLILLPAFIAFAVAPGALVRLVLGERYAPFATLLPLLVPGYIAAGIAVVYATALRLAGHSGLAALAQGIGACTSVAAALILAPRNGLSGLVVAITIGHVVLCAAMLSFHARLAANEASP